MAFAGQIFSISPAAHLRHWRYSLLSFHLKDNFRFPYAAIGFFRFWRGGISLSTFLGLPLHSARRQ
jgi:hypothetical protein